MGGSDLSKSKGGHLLIQEDNTGVVYDDQIVSNKAKKSILKDYAKKKMSFLQKSKRKGSANDSLVLWPRNKSGLPKGDPQRRKGVRQSYLRVQNGALSASQTVPAEDSR